MMKKLIATILSGTMAFILTVPVWAASESEFEKITPDTIITEENMYEVFEYLNFTPMSIKETDVVATQPVTVRDFSNAIEDAAQTADVVIEPMVVTPNPDYMDEGNMLVASIGLKPLYYDAENSVVNGVTIRYLLTGEYYMNGDLRYWTKAVTNDIYVRENSTRYGYDVEVKSMSAAAYEMGSYARSYIELRAQFDLVQYQSINNFDVEIGRNNVRVEGLKFLASDWL